MKRGSLNVKIKNVEEKNRWKEKLLSSINASEWVQWFQRLGWKIGKTWKARENTYRRKKLSLDFFSVVCSFFFENFQSVGRATSLFCGRVESSFSFYFSRVFFIFYFPLFLTLVWPWLLSVREETNNFNAPSFKLLLFCQNFQKSSGIWLIQDAYSDIWLSLLRIVQTHQIKYPFRGQQSTGLKSGLEFNNFGFVFVICICIICFPKEFEFVI